MHGTPLLPPKGDHQFQEEESPCPPPFKGRPLINAVSTQEDYNDNNMSNNNGGDDKSFEETMDEPKASRWACDEAPGICAILITFMSIVLVFVTIPFSLCFAVKVVQEYERVVIFRLGRLLRGGARGPGIFFIVPCVDSYQKVDMRTLTFDVPPQEILTKDSVTVHVDAIMYYKVSNAISAISNVDDYSQSTRLLAATTLRNVLGTKNLGDILSEREGIASMMQSTLDEATDPWGVKVEQKDVRLPQQLQRAMAAEAEAAREARAKVIAAEGEHKSSRALAQAAEVIAASPAALQLRYLQTLNNISAEKNSTIVFPIPIDIVSHLMGNRGGRSSPEVASRAPTPPPPRETTFD
ncbi:STOM [Lepeophtheirus salmonis]|uniref:STOM n=1 Tax=Lepeophtheirus salmonis TaxID=72036 RepID=A0A7R8CDN1_LEPSM|nr:STOM [Lepeophtheirus salmonis]CAF2781673.1 STOM [Lepeophtheirus salmonis]